MCFCMCGHSWQFPDLFFDTLIFVSDTRPRRIRGFVVLIVYESTPICSKQHWLGGLTRWCGVSTQIFYVSFSIVVCVCVCVAHVIIWKLKTRKNDHTLRQILHCKLPWEILYISLFCRFSKKQTIIGWLVSKCCSKTRNKKIQLSTQHLRLGQMKKLCK